MAGCLRRGSVGGRLDARGGRPPVHGRRRDRPGVLRRDRSRVSARPLDPAAARADDCRRRLLVAAVDLAVAVRDRSSPGRRLDRGHGPPADGNPTPVDPVRGRLPGQPDAGHRPRASQPDDTGRAGGLGNRPRGPLAEGTIRTEPADPARHLRFRAGHRVRECRESSACPRGRAPGADGHAARARSHAPADRRGSSRRERAARGGRRGRGAAGGRRCHAPTGRAGPPGLDARADRGEAVDRRAVVRGGAVARGGRARGCRARVARRADGSHRCPARLRAQRRRFLPCAHGPADRSGVAGRRGRRRLHHARAKSREPPAAGPRLRRAGAGADWPEAPAVQLRPATAVDPLPRHRATARGSPRRARSRTGAVQPVCRQLGRVRCRRRPSAERRQ